MRKTFKLSLGGRTVTDLVIEGDDDIVESFVKYALTDSFGAFYNTREAFTEIFINGIKHEIQVVKRTPDGKFAPKPPKPVTPKGKK